jgi:hypothetical protein
MAFPAESDYCSTATASIPVVSRYTVGELTLVKDALERKLHKIVCAGQLDLKTPQREMVSNWIEAYQNTLAKHLPLG